MSHLCFQDGERDHQPRNIGRLQELVKARRQNRFSLKLPEGTQPCQHPDFRLLIAKTVR